MSPCEKPLLKNSYEFNSYKWYFVTLTFPSHLSVSQKLTKINNLNKFLITRGIRKFIYSIEYHKYPTYHRNYVKDGENDNPFCPHVHLIFGTRTLNNFNLNWILQDFRSKYGNTKVDFLHEEMDLWTTLDYLLKDVKRLNEKYSSYQHLIENDELTLEQQESLNEEEKRMNDVNVIEYESDDENKINKNKIKII